MRKKTSFITALVLTFIIAFGNSVFAFQDLHGDSAEAKIRALKEHNVVSGISGQLFDPQGTLTYAQAVQMLVTGFELNIDHLQFIKEPKASDYFTNVPDEAWYARAFMIAQLNGLPVPQDVHPYEALTKEMYADLLFHALDTRGPFPMIRIFILIADEKDIDNDKMGSIQSLLILKIAELNESGQFLPKMAITRSEAASLLYNALEFVKQRNKGADEADKSSEEVTVAVEPIHDDVNKVTLAWGEKSNGCYGISIDKIEFANNEAIIYYSVHFPEPTDECIQVITYPAISTYIDNKYNIKLQQSSDSSTVNPSETGVPGKPGETVKPDLPHLTDKKLPLPFPQNG